MRWGVMLADLALLLVAASATARTVPPEPAQGREAAAVATFALAYAPGAAESADARALPAWLARERDDAALGLVLTASIDAADVRSGVEAGLALAAERAARVLATLDETRAVEVRLLPDAGRRVTVSLRYD